MEEDLLGPERFVASCMLTRRAEASASSPKVSVLMITYNHERFIKQAVESVLMQKTSFDFELVIGEDCSRDRTREIVLEYARRCPDRIRLLPSERNVGPYPNFSRSLEACEGQYVAVLEGDDYWISSHKLQKQADFLDAHLECSSCFHTVQVVSGDGRTIRIHPAFPERDLFALEDILSFNFVPTCSVMFRRDCARERPEWLGELKMGDWPLHILIAQYGRIGFINEVMGVYRDHGGGLWRSTSKIDWIREFIRMLEMFNAHTQFRYDRIIRRLILAWRLRLLLALAEQGNVIEARNLFKVWTAERPQDRIPMTWRVAAWTGLSFPALYRLILSRQVLVRCARRMLVLCRVYRRPFTRIITFGAEPGGD